MELNGLKILITFNFQFSTLNFFFAPFQNCNWFGMFDGFLSRRCMQRLYQNCYLRSYPIFSSAYQHISTSTNQHIFIFIGSTLPFSQSPNPSVFKSSISPLLEQNQIIFTIFASPMGLTGFDSGQKRYVSMPGFEFWPVNPKAQTITWRR